MIYSVVIYDENDARVAVLQNASNPRYTRSLNAADQVGFSIPKTDTDASSGEIVTGRRFEILRSTGFASTVVECSGFISSHGYSGDTYEINGFTEEILLTNYLTPPQFGYALASENANIGELAQELQRGYSWVRVKRNWATYLVDSSNIDYTTNPDFMLLSSTGTDADGLTTYNLTGYAVFRFQKLGSETWERFRWVGDYYEGDEGAVTTKVSYRQSNSPGGGTYGAPLPGSATDSVGIILPDPDMTYVDVRVDFETTEETTSPVLFALEAIKRTPTEIDDVVIVGDTTALVTPGLEADEATFLDVLTAALEPHAWELQVSNKVLTIKSTFGTDRTNDYSVVGV